MCAKLSRAVIGHKSCSSSYQLHETLIGFLT
jgi:hypothetical protein